MGAIKTEFGQFSEILERVKRQLNTATKTIESTGVRTRAIERKLRAVDELTEVEATAVLALPAPIQDDELDNTGEPDALGLDLSESDETVEPEALQLEDSDDTQEPATEETSDFDDIPF